MAVEEVDGQEEADEAADTGRETLGKKRNVESILRNLQCKM